MFKFSVRLNSFVIETEESNEPLLIEQPLLNTNSTEDACICTNNTVVNIDLNESTDIVENVYNESVSENESTCSGRKVVL
jgi:hypothetical protein